jgi:hypothetical protein
LKLAKGYPVYPLLTEFIADLGKYPKCIDPEFNYSELVGYTLKLSPVVLYSEIYPVTDAKGPFLEITFSSPLNDENFPVYKSDVESTY